MKVAKRGASLVKFDIIINRDYLEHPRIIIIDDAIFPHTHAQHRIVATTIISFSYVVGKIIATFVSVDAFFCSLVVVVAISNCELPSRSLPRKTFGQRFRRHRFPDESSFRVSVQYYDFMFGKILCDIRLNTFITHVKFSCARPTTFLLL